MKIYISTMFGQIVVNGSIESNYKDLLSQISEIRFNDLKCNLSIDTVIAGNPQPEPRTLDIGFCVLNDLLSILKANKESDERHQVPMETIEIHRVYIDGKNLLIMYTFNDDQRDATSRRLIHGNVNEIHEPYDRCERKNWFAMPIQNCKVAW